MTEQQFRASPELRAQLAEVLTSDAFVKASGIILDAMLCLDVDESAPEVASVRILSQRSGRESAFRKLHQLTEALPEPQRDTPNDFGASDEALRLSDLPDPFGA